MIYESALTNSGLKFTKRRGLTAWSSFLLLLCISACSALQTVPDYDEATDKSLTQIQQVTDDFIIDLESKSGTDAAAYKSNLDFYTKVDKLLRPLEFRVGSISNNDATIDLVGKIRTVILGNGPCSATGASLRDLHCTAPEKASDNAPGIGPSKDALEIARRNINQTISAALELEIDKKQGKAPSSKK